jgi:hypothetical protein
VGVPLAVVLWVFPRSSTAPANSQVSVESAQGSPVISIGQVNRSHVIISGSVARLPETSTATPPASNVSSPDSAELVFDVAIVELVDPRDPPILAIEDSMEPYPMFPCYSNESDHPAAWPPRVWRDRQELGKRIETFLEQRTVKRRLAAWKRSENSARVESHGSARRTAELARMVKYGTLRAYFNQKLKGDTGRLIKEFGDDFAKTFLQLEDAREHVKQQMPNRLMVMRIENHQPTHVRELRTEFEVAGTVYDVTLNGEEVLPADENLGKPIVVELSSLKPNYYAEIRLWYTYLPVSERVFPGARDLILEESQGIVFRNLVISNGMVRRDSALLADLEAAQRYHVDPFAHRGMP